MTLLSLSLRVAISAGLLTLFLGSVTPMVNDYLDQKQILADITQLERATKSKLKLERSKTRCYPSVTVIPITTLISDNLLHTEWNQKHTSYSVTINRENITSVTGSTYSKPTSITIERRFLSKADAQPFYGISDRAQDEKLYFFFNIPTSNSSLNSYFNSKNGCYVL